MTWYVALVPICTDSGPTLTWFVTLRHGKVTRTVIYGPIKTSTWALQNKYNSIYK